MRLSTTERLVAREMRDADEKKRNDAGDQKNEVIPANEEREGGKLEIETMLNHSQSRNAEHTMHCRNESRHHRELDCSTKIK
jgi:hypothetical protein